jgi:hypothetical protein
MLIEQCVDDGFVPRLKARRLLSRRRPEIYFLDRPILRNDVRMHFSKINRAK